ncbi:MAG: hypothetical protein ABIE84_03275 [bacterium]
MATTSVGLRAQKPREGGKELRGRRKEAGNPRLVGRQTRRLGYVLPISDSVLLTATPFTRQLLDQAVGSDKYLVNQYGAVCGVSFTDTLIIMGSLRAAGFNGVLFDNFLMGALRRTSLLTDPGPNPEPLKSGGGALCSLEDHYAYVQRTGSTFTALPRLISKQWGISHVFVNPKKGKPGSFVRSLTGESRHSVVFRDFSMNDRNPKIGLLCWQ